MTPHATLRLRRMRPTVYVPSGAGRDALFEALRVEGDVHPELVGSCERSGDRSGDREVAIHVAVEPRTRESRATNQFDRMTDGAGIAAEDEVS